MTETAKTVRLVFVCSGNICRSPMAAVITKHVLQERGQKSVIISAGTLDINGESAARNAQDAMTEIGLDLTNHRSQGIDLELMRFADAIVVMAPRHRDWLLRQAAHLEPKIVSLWEHYPEGEPGAPLGKIPDPVGKDMAHFRVCREYIQKSLVAWLDGMNRA